MSGTVAEIRKPKPVSGFANGLIRLRDILISLAGMLLLSPFFIFFVILIKRDSQGPVFYRGKRAAMGGGAFNILKFRTMYEEEQSYNGPKVTSEGDPRITPVGRWLRETKLNELPQLWNVFNGDMSIVGPRPEDPDIVAGWPGEVRDEILSVKPGITSPATVLFRNEESMLSHERVMETYLDVIQPSKMRLDQLYVRHRSFWLDLDVAFWTLIVLLPRLETFKPPEKSLFLGPVTKIWTRYASWFIIDFVTVFIAFGISGVFWRSLGPIHLGLLFAIFISLVFSLIFTLLGTVVGTHKIVWSTASANEVVDLALAAGLASGLSLLINRNKIVPFQIILLATVLAFIGFVLTRYRTRLLTGMASRLIRVRKVTSLLKENVLIVGCGKAGQFATWMLENGPNADRYQIVGFVDDDIMMQNSRLRGVEVLGRCEDIPQIVEQNDIGLILFAIHNIKPSERSILLKQCHQTQAEVVIVPDILNAMEKAVGNRGNGSQKPGAPSDQIPLITGISPEYLDAWLAELQEQIEQGHFVDSLSRIQAMRDRLSASEEKTRPNLVL